MRRSLSVYWLTRCMPVRLALMMFAALLPGCGSSKGTVSGKVVYRGQPVTSLNVNFYLKHRGLGDGTPLNADGNFAFPEPMESGTYAVFLSEVPPPPSPRRMPSKPAKVPDRYLDMNASGLLLTVNPGKNEFLIELEEKEEGPPATKTHK